MAGLFKRLFGEKSAENLDSETAMSFRWNRPSKDFYLSPDEAKTLGDIDYMRTPRTIHHTFPKVGTSERNELEFFDEVSSMGHFPSSEKH